MVQTHTPARGQALYYPVGVSRAGYQLKPKVALPPPSRNRPDVAILGDPGARCTPLLLACREQDIHFKRFCDAAALLNYAERGALSLVIVHADSLDLHHRRLLDALRGAGVQRVVLVGPSLGDAQYIEALEAGCDEVWPDTVPASALPVLVHKAWQTARYMPRADAQRVLTLGELVLVAESSACWVAGRKLNLGRACFAILQRLVLDFPGIASRAKLTLATRDEEDAGLDEGSRAVDVSVSRLRKKLLDAGMAGVRIKAVSGLGYQLCMDFPDAMAADHGLLPAAA